MKGQRPSTTTQLTISNRCIARQQHLNTEICPFYMGHMALKLTNRPRPVVINDAISTLVPTWAILHPHSTAEAVFQPVLIIGLCFFSNFNMPKSPFINALHG